MTVPTRPEAPAHTATAPEQAAAPAHAPRMRTGFFHPRWALLATMCYMPLALVGFAAHYYFTTAVQCNLGIAQALCTLDVQAAAVQVTLMLFAFALVYFAVASYGRGHEKESPVSDSASLASFAWRITEFQRVRPLAWIISALLVLGLLVEVARGRLDAVTLTLSLIALFTLVRGATYHPRRPATATGATSDGQPAGQSDTPAQTAHERSLGREASFWNVARNTPPLVWIFRTGHQ